MRRDPFARGGLEVDAEVEASQELSLDDAEVRRSLLGSSGLRCALPRNLGVPCALLVGVGVLGAVLGDRAGGSALCCRCGVGVETAGANWRRSDDTCRGEGLR